MTHGASRTIKFLQARIDPLPNDRCQAVVQVERVGRGPITGTAEGGAGQADSLRAAARAAADALSEAYEAEGVKVRVRGVQTVEAFGQTVIIVSLAASRAAETRFLLGVCDGRDDLARATALAVLNGTNRFLGLE